MASFILVHGTFARNASWTNEDSPLCIRVREAASKCGQPAKFIPEKWTGNNLGQDRIATARSIVAKIKAAQAENPDEMIFLIGHSHGGSAIAYLLKNFPDMRKSVAGCAFLSTPFIAQRLRPLWDELLTALVTVAGMLMFFLTAVITSYLFKLFGWLDHPGTTQQAVFAFATCFVIGAIVTVWIWKRIGPAVRLSLQGSLLRSIAESETADLPAGRHLFLRASGDEAAAALGAGQFIAWSIGKLVGFASVVVLRIRLMLGAVSRSYVGRAVLIVASMVFSLWLNALFLISFAFSTSLDQFARDVLHKNWHMGETDFGFAGTVIDWLATVLWPVFVFLFVGALLYAVILVVGLAIGVLTLRVFGWTNYREAVFTDFSVEPVPYGKVDFVHIDWKDQGTDALGLSHSRTYLNPRALECLAGWVSNHLRPAAVSGDTGVGQRA